MGKTLTTDVIIKEVEKPIKGSVDADGFLLDETGKRITNTVFILPGGKECTVGGLVRQGDKLSLWQKIIAQMILEKKIKTEKAYLDPFEESVEMGSVERVSKELEKEGVTVYGTPRIVIQPLKGEEIAGVLSQVEKTEMTVDREGLTEIISTLPEIMKEVTVKSSAELKALFKSGQIDEKYSEYFKDKNTNKLTIKASKK